MKTLKYALKNEWYNIILLVLPFAAIPFLSGRLPAQMALHWSLSGQAELYINRTLALTLIPAINLLLYFAILEQAKAQRDLRTLLRSMIVFVLLVIHISVILLNMGILHSYINFMLPLTAVILIISGFYLRKEFPLDLIGLLPWTLDNPENLQHINRFTAHLCIFGGLIMLMLFFFVSEKTEIDLFVITIVSIVFLPMLYAFYLHQGTSAK